MLKCFFGHKWEYSEEKLRYSDLSDLPVDIQFIVRQVGPVHNPKDCFFNVKVKLCSRCYKKQRENLLGRQFPEKNGITDGHLWMDFGLSPNEIRDKRLSDLGI